MPNMTVAIPGNPIDNENMYGWPSAEVPLQSTMLSSKWGSSVATAKKPDTSTSPGRPDASRASGRAGILEPSAALAYRSKLIRWHHIVVSQLRVIFALLSTDLERQ